MNSGYAEFDKDKLLEELEGNRQILDNIDIWKRVRPVAIVFPIICMGIALRVNAIVPSLLWLSTLGITELYVVYKNKKAKKNICIIENMIEDEVSIKDDVSVDKTMENTLGNYIGYRPDVQSKPYVRVRKKL